MPARFDNQKSGREANGLRFLIHRQRLCLHASNLLFESFGHRGMAYQGNMVESSMIFTLILIAWKCGLNLTELAKTDEMFQSTTCSHAKWPWIYECPLQLTIFLSENQGFFQKCWPLHTALFPVNLKSLEVELSLCMSAFTLDKVFVWSVCKTSPSYSDSCLV